MDLHQFQLLAMAVGAAEQGAPRKTQGLALGDKGLPFSGHDFPQSTWPRRGQAGTDVPGDAGHTRQKPCLSHREQPCFGALAVLLCLDLQREEEEGNDHITMRGIKHLSLREPSGAAEKTEEPQPRVFKLL